MHIATPAVPAVLRPPALRRCEAFDTKRFLGRMTVVSPLVYRKKQILLVRNMKGQNWIFVQGGYTVKDGVLSRAARREVREEVSLGDIHLFDYEIELGECLNEVTNKNLFVLAIPVRRMGDVVLCDGKNDRYEWVSSFSHFHHLIEPTAEAHPIKYKLMLDTLGLLRGQNLLDWEDVQPMSH